MHDPMTLIYGCRLFDLWHKDPERGGSDDSCGYCFPRLTEGQRHGLKNLAWSEAYEPWFQRQRAKSIEDPVLAECLMRGAVQMVARSLGVRMSWSEVCSWACRFIQTPLDNFRGGLCHMPGYHTNFEKDSRKGREDTAFGLFSGIARHILRDRRPWWRHPRWHVHHWRLAIRPLLSLKRFLFSRCAKCGRGFSWGYAPVSNSWDGPGPRWFRGEEGVMHHECSETAVGQAQGPPTG